MILVNGALGAYISRGARQLQVFLPDDEPARSTVARAVAGAARGAARERRGLLIAEIDGIPTVGASASRRTWSSAGFSPSAMGFMMRRAAGRRSLPSFNQLRWHDGTKRSDPADGIRVRRCTSGQSDELECPGRHA